jgi:phosphopantetheinyl transferase
MALFYQHNINGHTRLGVWKIEEDEGFFLKKVPLKKDVSHPYKRLQHLAGRYLLRTLFDDFPLEEIMIADTKKPFLQDEFYHFSISHCGNYAAAIVSRDCRVGVDIEMVTPRLITISSKFLNEEESIYLKDWEHVSKLHLDLVTVLWCAKESVFKWYGNGQVDFRKHMSLKGPMVFSSSEKIELPFIFQKQTPIPITVEAKIFAPLVLAWVVT